MFNYKIITNPPINYDGSQLRSHFVLEKSSYYGNGGVAFIGEAKVTIEHMVDLEDVRGQDFIYSPKMLHFILEFFPANIQEAVFWQRIFMGEIFKLLVTKYKYPFTLEGDDLFLEDKKLSVSIATISPISSLIHTGLNILTDNTPVKTVGLQELKINPWKLAEEIFTNFQKEYLAIKKATYKVRAVP